MSLIALSLVVVAASTHAGRNVLAEQAAHRRHFNWYYSVCAVLIDLPVAARGFVRSGATVAGASRRRARCRC